MVARFILLSFFFINCTWAQIKKQEHKDFRSPKEIELEKVVTEMKKQFKNNYSFDENAFYKVGATVTLNNLPFYLFTGISKLTAISPIACESTYQLDKERQEAYTKAENAIFKKERAPRELVPFYLPAVFAKLENIYDHYKFFSAKDYQYSLVPSSNEATLYELAFQSKNPKLPIAGKIILDKKTYTPVSLTYHNTSEYIFEMSAENFNFKKNTAYVVNVTIEMVTLEFQNVGNQFIVSKYSSEYGFKNILNDPQALANGDEGLSKISLERQTNEPKICNEKFNLDTLQ